MIRLTSRAASPHHFVSVAVSAVAITVAAWFVGSSAASAKGFWVHGIEDGLDTELYVLVGRADGRLELEVASVFVDQRRSGGFGTETESTWLGDVDGDLISDWVHAFEDAGTTRVFTYLGLPDGTFSTTAVETNVPGGHAGQNSLSESTFVADVDGDGHADWVHGIETGVDTELRVFRGQAGGSFATAAVTTLLDDEVRAGGWSSDTESTFLADVDGDGRGDWVHAFEMGGSTSFFTYRGQADGSFETQSVDTSAPGGFTGTNPTTESTFVADVDGDGRSDWVHGIESGLDTELFVFQGLASGGFDPTPVLTIIAGVGLAGSVNVAESTFVGDLNDDGFADWVHAREASGKTTFWVCLGREDATFQAPEISAFAIVGGVGRAGNDSLFEASFIGHQRATGTGFWVHGLESDPTTDLFVLAGSEDGTIQAEVTTQLDAMRSGGFGTDSESTWVADVDGDLVSDWIHAFEDGGMTRFFTYRGNRDGTFDTTAIETTVGGGHTGQNALSESTFVVDVDGDRRADWVHGIEVPGATELRVFRGEPSGGFATAAVVTTLAGQPRAGGWSSDTESTFAADVDGDGRADWVHAFEMAGTTFFFTYLGQGDGSFATTSVDTSAAGGFTGNNPTTESTFVADVDGDRRGDWVHGIESAPDTRLFVFRGQADGSFDPTPVETLVAGEGVAGGVSVAESTFLADITQDGLADWVHARESAGDTTFLVSRGTDSASFLVPVISVQPGIGGVGRAGNDALFEASLIGRRPSQCPGFKGLFGDGFETGGFERWSATVP